MSSPETKVEDRDHLEPITTSPIERRAPDVPKPAERPIDVESPEAFFNRELSWLGFARRVVSLVENPDLPLLERIKFAGISGMLHDEFFMKRMSGLKKQIRRGRKTRSVDGRTPKEEFNACREELLRQADCVAKVLNEELRPAMRAERLGIIDYQELTDTQKQILREYFEFSVKPILTPLAVDSEHPFPFISNLGLNLAILLPAEGGRERFVRIKVPNNRPRWVKVPEGGGVTPLEQVIAHNLDLLYPDTPPEQIYCFRVTRGAEGESEDAEEATREPGGIVEQVSNELKARRFAGVVRLQMDASMPDGLRRWLIKQLSVDDEEVYPVKTLLGLNDLTELTYPSRKDLHYPPHTPVTHPRLAKLDPSEPSGIFEEISRGDILLHHPYHSFDTSVLRFIESAAVDPDVLAIKLTIYRTGSDSPIVRALAEAARRGKQVAVLVEITARFDEAPNIAWGKFLENEGVHVAYGVERLKTHVKLALVVREEEGQVKLYSHAGTGNYHPRTARLYEDLGVLTADRELCAEVSAMFNSLTGSTPLGTLHHILVAPVSMRERFYELIHREIEHAEAGRPSGIYAKMNQLQDRELIGELYKASQAGVPITLNVRGLCCLRPGVPGLSETIRVYSVVGRFLEHSRVYRFENGGSPEFFIGSADWMRRNLKNRVETVAPILSSDLREELDVILRAYEMDNCSAWDCGPDGVYTRRTPEPGEVGRGVQDSLIERVRSD